MIKIDKSSTFKASLLAGLLATALSAHAAGLGKLTVYSAIGQPLNAEVALTASPEELSGLSARLASHEAFKDAGIEFMPALTGLRMSVVKLTNGQPVLRLTTDQALNEPFLHFLVELNWTAGRMVREYTFLLDPPEMLQPKKPAAVVSPVAPAIPKAAAKPLPEPASAPSSPSAELPQKAVRPVTPSSEGEVRVKQGDTLGKIAREYKPESVSLDQMLVALFNGNRDAFDGKNMNRLRAGKILRLPDAATLSSVDPKQARETVVAQAADFNAYKRRLAEAAVTSGAVAQEAPAQQASGKIKPQVEQKPTPAASADKLEVSRTEAQKSGRADGVKGKLEEELIARDKALREASERIAQLEKNLENLKKLAELKSQPGAMLQQQAEAAKPAAVPEDKKTPATPTPTPTPAAAKTAPEAAPAQPAAVQESPAKAEKPAEVPSPAPGAVAPPENAKPVEQATSAAPPPKVVAKKPVAPPPPPPPEPSFIEDNPEVVFAGGGLVAALLGYLGFNAWRRKKSASQQLRPAESDASMAGVASAPAAVASPAEAAAPADDVSILGDFSESGLTTEESVDPVAEADVLMAYGRDGQAEEILLEGLKTEPTRAAIHIKLLELYANRQETERFQSVAAELHTLNGGTGADWDKAVRLAAGMGVVGGLFAPADTVPVVSPAPVDVAEAVPAEQELAPPAAEAVEVNVDEVPVAEVEAQDAAALDFDLDLGTTSMPAGSPETLAAAAQEAAAPAADEVMSLDFDFDLGSPDQAAAPATPPQADAAVAEVPVDTAGGIDFALDEPAPVDVAGATPAVATEAAPAGNEIDFDIDLGMGGDSAESAAVPAASEMAPAAIDLGAISLDLGEPETVGNTPEVAAGQINGVDLKVELPATGAENAEVALPDIELDIGTPEEPAATGSAMPSEISLPDIDLDLDVSSSSVADIAAPASGDLTAATDLSLELEADAGELPATAETDDPEVATKLELAQAYEEMGDREGARELLNEVLQEGSTAQRQAAQARLAQLDIA